MTDEQIEKLAEEYKRELWGLNPNAFRWLKAQLLERLEVNNERI